LLRIETTFLLKTALVLQLLMNISLILNIVPLRQILVFVFLTFVLGLFIAELIGLLKLDLFYSIGLSLASVMFGGVIINWIYPLFGVATPLSMLPILLALDLFLILLYVLCFVFRRESKIEVDLGLSESPQRNFTIMFIISLICLLALGLTGVAYVNLYGDNRILLLTTVLVIPFFILPVVTKRIPSSLFALILVLTTVIILFSIDGQNALITKYVYGQGDQYLEFQVFKLTEINRLWVANFAQVYPFYSDAVTSTSYSMISVTILPTIVSQLLNIEDFWVFKILYPLIVALVPLGLYRLYSTQVDKKMALLSVFFFIAISVGKGWGSDKQLIAQLFYVLIFVCIFDKNLKSSTRNILLLVFVGGLALSHYALAYVFFFIILFVLIISILFRRNPEEEILSTKTLLSSQGISSYLVVAFSTIIFAWYSFATGGAPLQRLQEAFDTLRRSLFSEFFSAQSRAQALQGLGFYHAETAVNQIGAAFFYLTEILIVVGFVAIIIGKIRVDKIYKDLLIINMGILVMNIVLPRLSETFLMTRFYQTTLIFLAPLCIIGAQELVNRIKLKRRFVFPIISCILIILFLFQAGFMYEVAGGTTYSLPLSMNHWSDIRLQSTIINENDAYGAVWLSRNGLNYRAVYSDIISKQQVLTAAGVIGRYQIRLLTNVTSEFQGGAFVYIGRIASVDGIIFADYAFKTSEIDYFLENQNKVYTNGNCEIYEIRG